MNDENSRQETDHTHQGPDPHTHRYASAGHPQGPPQPPYGSPAAQPGPYGFRPEPPRRPVRPSGGFTALLLVAALVVGAFGGLVGSAGFAAVDYLNGDDGQANPSTAAEDTTESTVTKMPDTPAEKGSVEDVANSVLSSVVKINVRGNGGMGSGSGIILSSDGEILTNHHVVALAAQGGSLSVSFNDGSTAPAETIGTDPLTDLAVVKAKDVSGLTPATIGQSSNLDVGEQVVAIGSPFGLEATVTTGIVSAKSRPVSISGAGPNAIDTTYPAIQTDAAINPGNSGGPLVNMKGEVVGVNSSIRTSSGGSSGSIGLGFAIPIDKVLPIVEQLRDGEAPTHARLGVTVVDAQSENGLRSGAGINSVAADTAADAAGLQRGDVVVKVDDTQISGASSLVATVRGHRPGDEVTLTIVRDGERQTLEVTLGSDEGTTTAS